MLYRFVRFPCDRRLVVESWRILGGPVCNNLVLCPMSLCHGRSHSFAQTRDLIATIRVVAQE